MKLLHFSDTHLGFSEYHKIDPETGLNQREVDFYNAWQHVIDAILEMRPDVVIHAGDLFHTPRPSNRAIRVAMESVQRINDAGIPLVIVSGNHETPRIRSTGSIFESLDLFPNVYAAYQSRYEKFSIKGVTFHCIPHCSLTEEMETAFSELKGQIKGDGNVFISHGAWGGKQYGMGEFNEQRLPDPESTTGKTFDYIALGHYHRHVAVRENACYSSSTERTSLNEHDSTCGYVVVDLDSHKKSYHEIQTRPMRKLPSVDCDGLHAAEIYQAVEKLADETIEQAIVQLQLDHIEQDAFLTLDMRVLDEIFRPAFMVQKQLLRKVNEGQNSAGSMHIASLPVEFERYLSTINVGELDLERLFKMGAAFLEMN